MSDRNRHVTETEENVKLRATLKRISCMSREDASYEAVSTARRVLNRYPNYLRQVSSTSGVADHLSVENVRLRKALQDSAALISEALNPGEKP